MSKRLTLISLLVVVTSACTHQVTPVPSTPDKVQATQLAPSNTLTAESTLSIAAAWTELALTKDAIVHPTLTTTPTAVDTATAQFAACPGAPGPYAALGKEVTIVAEDVDKLKLRSEPEISPDNVIRELNRFTQLKIVGGPVCVHSGEMSYWFWQVQVDREIGWVAEGDVQHSFLVVSVGQQFVPPTATADTATTPSACRSAHPSYAAGTEVTVIVGGSDKLKLRSEPVLSADTVRTELDQFTKLKIIGGAMCVTSAETGISYWLWKVKVISSGETGWVAEGDAQNNFIEAIVPP